jgi:hypothetical protein
MSVIPIELPGPRVFAYLPLNVLVRMTGGMRIPDWELLP